ncbi:MAG TPA: large-conductance mechanosensitive channel protein MscL [Bacteroidetes bacterium]|nr:large-conductance mechanosensitive channel protein MscL [Bacteroidota bacterium]
MLQEFKDFAAKGSLIDIAVGFVMGAAFGKVVTSFTDGIVSPLIGMIFNADFNSLKWILKPAEMAADGTEAAAEVAVMYGSFLTSVIDFIIVAWVMFMVVKGANKMKKKQEEAAPAAPPAQEVLLGEIRDLLKKK